LIAGLMNVVCLAMTLALVRSPFYNYYADLSEKSVQRKNNFSFHLTPYPSPQ
jgi:hypothetical protein